MSEITLPVTLNNQTLAVTKVASALPRLQLGDLLQATVLSNKGGKAELQLPQGTLTARTDLPLRAGEQLKLTVAQTQPQVTLSISKPATPPAELLSQKVYPKQQPLSQAIQNLGQLMQSQTSGKGSQIAIQQLLQQLPTLTQLFNPKNLKGQVEKSGNFMENNLLNNRGEGLKGDLKMQLLQMKAKLMGQPDQQTEKCTEPGPRRRHSNSTSARERQQGDRSAQLAAGNTVYGGGQTTRACAEISSAARVGG